MRPNDPATPRNVTSYSAMLLAAGRGERMRPLTDSTAKPLLKVNDKRLIDYHLEKLASAGIQQVVINTCWQGDKIKSAIGDGSAFGLQIEYSSELTALETAGGIRKALDLLGNNPFLVVSADVWSDIDYSEIITIAGTVNSRSCMAHLLMVDNPPHHSDGDFSIDEANRLCLKKTKEGTRNLPSYTYSGIGLFHPALFQKLPIKPLPLLNILVPAIEAESIFASVHRGQWFDVGTVDRLEALDTLLRY